MSPQIDVLGANTLDRMAVPHLAAFLLRQKLLMFFVPSLQLLYPLIVVIYGSSECPFGALLPDNVLIQMRLQHSGRYSRCADVAGCA